MLSWVNLTTSQRAAHGGYTNSFSPRKKKIRFTRAERTVVKSNSQAIADSGLKFDQLTLSPGHFSP